MSDSDRLYRKESPPVMTVSLEKHVHKLLDSGLRSHDEEFQTLFRVFGKDKITGYAKAYLALLAEKKREIGDDATPS